jgi:sugar/nucleoside kinase (ribokinase family)
MSEAFDLVAFGLTTLDISAAPVAALPAPDEGMLVDAITLEPAGTAAGCALVAAVLGARAAIASAVGADTQGMVVRHLLQARGVDTSMLATDPDRPTSTTILPVRADGQRPNIHLLGASVFAGVPGAAWEALSRTRAVHWGGVGLPGLQPEGVAYLKAARTAGAFVTCDLIAPGEAARDDLVQLLPHVDLFMPSLAEVRFLAGTSDVDAAADHFIGAGATACLFKMGAEGAYYAAPDLRVRVPSFDIVPVDTTSCGDSFCAGFITARSRGMEIENAMRFASATAALVAQGLGTLGRLTDFAAAHAYSTATPIRPSAAA